MNNQIQIFPNLERLGQVVQYRGYRSRVQFAIARTFVIIDGKSPPRTTNAAWSAAARPHSSRARTLEL